LGPPNREEFKEFEEFKEYKNEDTFLERLG
jgi:hypothetical protein